MTSITDQPADAYIEREHVDPPAPSLPSTEPEVFDSFEAWHLFGIEQGWVGPDICLIHDGEPNSAEELDTGEVTGEMDCYHVLRMYPSSEVKAQVEAFHEPSVWRKPNQHRNHPDTIARVAEGETARIAAVAVLEAAE